MNNEKLSPFVSRFLKTWAGHIGLGGWVIHWSWEQQKTVDDGAGYPAYALTQFDTARQAAHISVSKDRKWTIEGWNVLGHDSLKQTLLHELVHIRVSGGEVMLGNLGAIFDSYLPESVNHAAHELQTGIREFYVDAIVRLLLSQEDRWSTKTSTKHKRQ